MYYKENSVLCLGTRKENDSKIPVYIWRTNRQAFFSKKFEYRTERNSTANGNRETYWKTIWFMVIIIATA